MFTYESTQQHTTIHNGKERTKRTSVSIHGSAGTKEVMIKETGRPQMKKTMRLTPREIACIRRCQFIPGLFADCKPCIAAAAQQQPTRQQMTRKKRRIH